jgi:hypothetical protein
MRPAHASRLLALLLLVGAWGSVSTDVGAFGRVSAPGSAASDRGSEPDSLIGTLSTRSRHLPALTTDDAEMAARLASARVDQWLEQLWWAAFALTTMAYALVLGTLGVRRLRGAHSRHPAWAVPELPVVAAQGRHVGPHL